MRTSSPYTLAADISTCTLYGMCSGRCLPRASCSLCSTAEDTIRKRHEKLHNGKCKLCHSQEPHYSAGTTGTSARVGSNATCTPSQTPRIQQRRHMQYTAHPAATDCSGSDATCNTPLKHHRLHRKRRHMHHSPSRNKLRRNRGNTPSCGPAARLDASQLKGRPSREYVFPDPAPPYANKHTSTPCQTSRSMGMPTACGTC